MATPTITLAFSTTLTQAAYDDDTLKGGSGRDTYVMGMDGGRDTLLDIAGGESVISLAQGDETGLSYSRMGQSLLVTNAALNTSC